MSRDLLERLEPLTPLDFFSIEVDLPYRKLLRLPDTSEMLAEESFAEVAAAWDNDSLRFSVSVKKAFEETLFPDYEKGDSLELFIDTRDLKTAGFMTRFCHHFLILPTEVQEISSSEITHFRSEDRHPLCDPSEIRVETDFRSSSYQLNVVLPSSCLHGYDPSSFQRLGFTYRLNRFRGDPQHFSVSSRDYNIAQHPSLWSRLHLKR